MGAIFTGSLTLFVGFIFGLVTLISGAISSLAASVLSWVLSSDFMKWSYVFPDKNPIINIGWSLTRDLANAFLIIILVFIGLLTALGIEEYKAKKTLPKLIIAALLINFTPVIVGLIVDASNILINFFAQDLRPGEVWSSHWEFFKEQYIPHEELWNPLKDIQRVMISLIIIIYDLISAFVFLIYTVLFFARYLVIWLLVILAPLAFAAWIFDYTRRWWTAWWDQLAKWCLVGIIAVFFLYLNVHLLKAIGERNIPTRGPTEGLTGFYDMFLGTIPTLTILVFSIIGLFATFSITATGASTIVGLAKRGGGAAMGWAGRAGRRGWERSKAWAKEKLVPEKVRKTGEKMAVYAPKGKVAQVIGAPVWALGRAMGRAVGPSLIETERREIDEAEKKVTGQRVEAQLAAYKKAITDKERIGVVNAMIKDKNIDDAMDVKKFGDSALSKDKLEKLYPIAQDRYNRHTVLRSAFPDIAARNLPPGTIVPTGVTPLEFTLERVKPAEYENVSRATLGNDEFIDTVLKRGTGEQVSRIIATHQQAAIRPLEKRLRVLGGGKFLQDHNPRLHRYFTAGAGRGLIHIAPPREAVLPKRPSGVPPDYVLSPGGLWVPPERPERPSWEEKLRRRREVAGLPPEAPGAPPSPPPPEVPPPPPLSAKVERLRKREEEMRKKREKRIERLKKRGEK